MCAEQNRGLFGFSRCARSKTEVCLASADARGAKQRSVRLQPMRAEQNRGLFGSADVRGAKQRSVRLQPMRAEQNRGLFGSADAREAKQRSVRLQPMRAEQNRGLFGFSRCARSKTEVCSAQPMRAKQNRGLFGVSENVWTKSSARSGRLRPPAKFGRVQGKIPPRLVPSKLPRPRLRPARSKTEVCSAQPMCAHARGSHSRTKTMGEQRQDTPRSLPAGETDRS